MSRRPHLDIILAFVCLLLPATAAAQHEHPQPPGEPSRLGEVHFATSCDAAVQPAFNRAVALLHSFWYEAAGAAFAQVAEKDPACSMAHWGIAMSRWQPLWTPPGAEGLQAGAAAVERATALGAKTERERDFIAAIATFYKDHETVSHRDRVLAYERAMEQLFAKYPDDTEAALFYSLALQAGATVSPPDPGYVRQKQAGKIAEPVFAAHPDHPGAAHYVIHAYDYPPLADRALAAARAYAKIAPDSPHALHMPSHIFTRLGYWEESIASNRDSRDAGRKHRSPGDELHAIDYLVYAYLQTGQDELARQEMARAPRAVGGGGSIRFAGLYAIASMPARYTLERRQWKEAAALELPEGVFPGGPQSWTEMSLHFAKGLGAARTGNLAAARAAIERLAAIRESIRQVAYWPDAAEVHRRVVAAWVAHAEGRHDEALAMLRSAAELEDKIDKHPVTPGYVLPARELLGDMLLERNRPAEALAEYEAALRSSPGRFNSTYGAARAAELAGNSAKAAAYYQALVKLAGPGDGRRAELRHASEYLAQVAAAHQP
jgi:tetratricopeptide (TPR) repeat protein